MLRDFTFSYVYMRVSMHMAIDTTDPRRACDQAPGAEVASCLLSVLGTYLWSSVRAVCVISSPHFTHDVIHLHSKSITLRL